jgi:hypothetical protein
VISKELNFSDFSLARISSIVLWTIFSSSIPKTVALISLARQKKVRFQSLGELGNAALQMHGDFACKHVNLLRTVPR